MKTLSVIGMALAGALASGAALAQAQMEQQPGQQQPGQQQAGEQLAGLQVAQQPQLGQYLADSQGRALYVFTADQQGAQQSACSDQCAEAWPPATPTAQPQVGAQIQMDMLGTITRQDGKQQVTYNGYPLYYFTRDQAPGQVAGQDVEGFGGQWYAMAPDGQAIRTEQRAQQPR